MVSSPDPLDDGQIEGDPVADDGVISEQSLDLVQHLAQAGRRRHHLVRDPVIRVEAAGIGRPGLTRVS